MKPTLRPSTVKAASGYRFMMRPRLRNGWSTVDTDEHVIDAILAVSEAYFRQAANHRGITVPPGQDSSYTTLQLDRVVPHAR